MPSSRPSGQQMTSSGSQGVVCRGAGQPGVEVLPRAQVTLKDKWE